MHRTLRIVVTALVVVVVLSGCGVGGTKMQKDAAGMTRADVARLSLHEEYDRYRDRYGHMQRILEDAQVQVYDGAWEWNSGDRVPGGGEGVVPLRGSDVENSYFLHTARLWSPSGASGAPADLEPMVEYFTAQGWQVYDRTLGDDHDVRGVTGDGWQVFYTVQSNGRYSLDVYSEPFWTNDARSLRGAVAGRSERNYPEESLPGVYPPFPEWDAPIVSPPKI
ncbi:MULTISPECIES: hypothetical protein [unclassified Curtobacterium]|uniref:hypothetical protein n=1 Tax=unclassified Curtobacterium TaxID=257496 RepID=UPI0011CD8883|nr:MULTISPECIES: hypothetical protein [unclassified Curtobacterium]